MAALLLGLFCVGAAPGAPAPDERLGIQGQSLAFGRVGAELTFGASTRFDVGATRAWDLAIGATPGMLHFVIENLALGGALRAGYGDYAMRLVPFTELELGAEVGVGINIPLEPGVSLFPQLFVGGGYARRAYDRMLPPSSLNPDSASSEPSEPIWSGPYLGGELAVLFAFQLNTAVYAMVGPYLRLRAPMEEGRSHARFGFWAGLGGVF